MAKKDITVKASVEKLKSTIINDIISTLKPDEDNSSKIELITKFINSRYLDHTSKQFRALVKDDKFGFSSINRLDEKLKELKYLWVKANG